MLHSFITEHRDEIVAYTRAKVSSRLWPTASVEELESGIPLFLTQLSETLRLEAGDASSSDKAIGASAANHGSDLLARGYTVSQVVHDYGDVCQAITELAVNKKARIGSDEFQTLNRCLDTAIAEAVTEYAREKDDATSRRHLVRHGQVVHELRNALQTAALSFQVLKTARVGINSSTGAMLARSLVTLHDLVEALLTDVRLDAASYNSERISLRSFIEDIAIGAALHAESRGLQLAVEAVDPTLEIDVDSSLLESALMNLLHNAFKFTRARGRVILRTRSDGARVFIEVEDECGGLTGKDQAAFVPFSDRRASDRSGVGLGLSITRKAVKANGGEVRSYNLPGKGCIFAIELPLAPAQPRAATEPQRT